MNNGKFMKLSTEEKREFIRKNIFEEVDDKIEIVECDHEIVNYYYNEKGKVFKGTVKLTKYKWESGLDIWVGMERRNVFYYYIENK